MKVYNNNMINNMKHKKKIINHHFYIIHKQIQIQVFRLDILLMYLIQLMH